MPGKDPDLNEFLGDLYALRDARAFRRYLLPALHRIVPCDSISYHQFHATRPFVVTSIHHPPDAHAARLLPVFNRHAAQHPVLAHWRKAGAPRRVLTWTDFASPGEFERSALYRDYFQPLGIRYQLAFLLARSPDRMVCVWMNRSEKDFSSQERRAVEGLRPHLVRALANALRFSRLYSVLHGRDRIEAHLHRGAIALRPNNRIEWASATAAMFLEDYFPDAGKRGGLPGPLAQWVAEQDGRSGDLPPKIPVPSPFTIQGLNAILTVRLLQDGRHRYLLLDERRVPSGNKAFLAFGLTDREIEVLQWVARGKSNADIASILGVSQRTVAKHLERTFLALGVENRTAAAAKVHQVMRRHGDLK